MSADLFFPLGVILMISTALGITLPLLTTYKVEDPDTKKSLYVNAWIFGSFVVLTAILLCVVFWRVMSSAEIESTGSQIQQGHRLDSTDFNMTFVAALILIYGAVGSSLTYKSAYENINKEHANVSGLMYATVCSQSLGVIVVVVLLIMLIARSGVLSNKPARSLYEIQQIPL